MEETKKHIKEDLRKIFESRAMVKILYGIGIVIVLLAVFSAGITVGFHKASFGRAWGENYNENFGIGYNNDGGVSNIKNGFGMMNNFPNAHGAVGKIIEIAPPNIIVQDKDNTEKVVSISDDTQIEKVGAEIGITDLNVNDFTVTIGTPNDQGIIEAKFIRVIPSPQLLK